MKRFSISLVCALMLAPVSALAAPSGMTLPPQPKVRPAAMPPGFVMVSPCIPQMGEHWANPRAKSMTLLYGTYQGKPIFSELMIPLKQLESGFNYGDLAALPGYHIDHVQVDYEPHGHPGMPIPHYDIHAYYITPAQQAKICPNG